MIFKQISIDDVIKFTDEQHDEIGSLLEGYEEISEGI